jgi:hypothetical protein
VRYLPRVRGQRATVCLVLATTIAAALACFSPLGVDYSGAVPCPRPSDGSTAISCAIVSGSVVDVNGAPMDGVTGSVRFQPSCDCLSPVIKVDGAGLFSTTVFRVHAPVSGLDTTTATVVLFATDPKYPMHPTGGFYFDTARVALSFAPIGRPSMSVATRLRIPIAIPPGRS